MNLCTEGMSDNECCNLQLKLTDEESVHSDVKITITNLFLPSLCLFKVHTPCDTTIFEVAMIYGTTVEEV